MQKSIRLRLSILMFLEYFIWGAWYVTMGTYLLKNLKADAIQVGSSYANLAIAAIISPFLVGLIADRYFSAQKVLGVLHLMGAATLYYISNITEFSTFWWLLLLYTLLYMPTMSLANSISFTQMKDAGKEFPSIRVFGTIGWIAVGLLIGFMKIESSPLTFYIAAIASFLLGIFSFFLILQPFLSVIAQKSQQMQILRKNITDEFSSQNGTFAVAFYDLNSNKSLFINEDTIFHAASTMKTPVMIEVFKQAAEGKFSLDDSLIIKNEFKSIVDGSPYSLDSLNDSESEIYRHVGEKRSIYDLMYQMIINSSNLSTNIIVDLVGAKNIMKTMKELGANHIQVLRGVEDQKAYDAGMNNTTTAKDLMILFRAIANGKTVNKSACKEMIKILEDQKHNKVIPALLPSDVKVAHKTGNITGVQHDSGIVFLPGGKKYVLVLLSKNLENTEAAIASMARVSKMIYDYVVSQ